MESSAFSLFSNWYNNHRYPNMPNRQLGVVDKTKPVISSIIYLRPPPQPQAILYLKAGAEIP